jgi:hypothetical protein
LKISQNNAKLPQERPKNLTKYLVIEQPKMTFYFWTKQFGACKKKKEKQYQIKDGWYQRIWRLKNKADT